MTANNQWATPGIRSASDVPVTRGGEVCEKRWNFHGFWRERTCPSHGVRRFAAVSNGWLWWLAPVLKDWKWVSGEMDDPAREKLEGFLIHGRGTYIA